MIAEIQESCAPLRDYVCPLYAKHRGQGLLLGTGVPLRLAGAPVIVTASHVLDAFGERCIYTLGYDDVLGPLSGERFRFEHVKMETIDVDLALIALTPQECEELNRRFSFTLETDLREALPSDEIAFYVMVGYPFSRNKPTPQSRSEVNATALCFVSRRITSVDESPETGKHGTVHFCMPARPDGTRDMTGTLASPPKPHGVSGGGVWTMAVDPVTGRLSVPRLIGVGIEYDQKNCQFICTRIRRVQPLADELRRSGRRLTFR